MRRVCLSVLFLLLSAFPALAATVTVASQTLVWYDSPVGSTVTLQYEYTEDGIDNAGNPVRRGTPAYRVTCTVTSVSGVPTLTIPSHTISSTVDFVRPRLERYNLFFLLPNSQKKPWQDFQGMRVNVEPAQTFGMISIFNKNIGGDENDGSVYTKFEVDSLIQNNTLFNPLTVQGSLLYGGAVVNGKATPTGLALGTTGQFLRAGATAPVYQALAGSDINTALGYTAANAGNLSAASLTGTLPNGVFPATLPAASGANLTNLNATNLATGAVPLARIAEVAAIGDLSNVDTSGLATNQFLAYNGTQFTPRGGTPNASSATNLYPAPIFSSGVSTDLSYSGVTYPTNQTLFDYWVPFVPGPGRVGLATHGDYSDAGAGANFHLFASAFNSGSRNTVAIGAIGVQRAAGTSWGMNPIGYTDVAGSVVATGIGEEVNFGNLGVSTGASAYGVLIAAIATGSTPAGSNKAYIQIQANSSLAAAANGIVFNAAGVPQPVVASGSLITGAFLSLAGGLNFAGSEFTSFGIKLPGIKRNGSAGVRQMLAWDTTRVSDGGSIGSIGTLQHSFGAADNTDFLVLGDSLSITDGAQQRGWDEIRFATKGVTTRARVWADGLGAPHLNGWHPTSALPALTLGAFTGGGTASPSVNTTAVTGRDPGHRIAFTTTAAPAPNAKICTVTFAEGYDNTPMPVVVPVGAQAGTIAAHEVYIENLTTTGYELWSGDTPLSATTAYLFDIVTIGY